MTILVADMNSNNYHNNDTNDNNNKHDHTNKLSLLTI